jgi:hypothetical protein
MWVDSTVNFSGRLSARFGRLAQPAGRALALHARCREFDPLTAHHFSQPGADCVGCLRQVALGALVGIDAFASCARIYGQAIAESCAYRDCRLRARMRKRGEARAARSAGLEVRLALLPR